MYTIIGICLIGFIFLILPPIMSLFIGVEPFGGLKFATYYASTLIWIFLCGYGFINGITYNNPLAIISPLVLSIFITPMIIAMSKEEGAIHTIKNIVNKIKVVVSKWTSEKM